MAPSPSSLLRGRLSLFLFCCLLLLSLHCLCIAGPVSVEFLRPDFTGAYLDYVDNNGVFLESAPASFHLSIFNPGRQNSRYYVSVIHAATGAVVWTANPSSPLSYSSAFSFTRSGFSVATSNSSNVRLTPTLPRPAALLRLRPTGELLLLDAANSSLWSSFDYPTDTLLPGQLLALSSSSSAVALKSSVSDSDLSPGDFHLALTSSDAVLQWASASQIYWTLSTDLRATKDSNSAVAYMAVNTTGLYLLAADKKTAVFQVILSPSSDDLRFVKLDSLGRLTILGYSSNETVSSSVLDTDFVAPDNDCDLPLKCGSFGICTRGGNGSTCSCPPLFSLSAGGCSPSDGSILAKPFLCSGLTTSSSSPVNYITLDRSIGYVGNKFAVPTTSGGDDSDCQNLCSANCSCLSYFYKNSSRSCYLIEHQLGSLSSGDSSTTIAGYFKIIKLPAANKNSNSSSVRYFAGILTPVIASFMLLVVLGFIGFKQWNMKRDYRDGETKRTKSGGSGRKKSWSMTSEFDDDEADKEDEDFKIPGLPTRFSYADLKDATSDFATRIGSGGFGSVYKGELPDRSVVAVKKINNIGLQGKREFCTEIAVIGNIHHVNLVKLRGYCMQGVQRLLVYEYMNRASLDRSLFGHGPPLEWQERMDIAVGAARGLAYLHSGCEQKIIHCDVKPENILLHDHNQVKIADFGLAKLLSPEQSGLFTTMRGTRGYLAPEWLTNAPISDKTDVYSFGMVLLEIVRGRKNRSEESEPVWTGSSSSSSSSGPATYFPSTALEMHGLGRYEELVDPRLEGRVTGPEIARVVKVALCCLHEEPAHRPSMAAVAGMLEGTRPVSEPRVELLSSLKLYGRGFSVDPKEKRGWPRPLNDSGGSAEPTRAASTSLPLLSYLSSQQLSGPR